MTKSWLQSELVLRRFTIAAAPIFTETYIGLLTSIPTASNPVGWVEWFASTNTPVNRIRVFQTDPVSGDPDGEPHWSTPESEGDTYETHNVNGVRWSDADTNPLLDGSETIVGVGVFTSSSTTYTDGIPTSPNDLIYWNTLTTNLTATQGESVVFLDGKIKVTEQ